MRKTTILIVDDDFGCLEQIRCELAIEEFVILTASYPGEAMEISEEHPEISATLFDGLCGRAFFLVKDMAARGLGGKLIAFSSDAGMNRYMCEDGCVAVMNKCDQPAKKIEDLKRILSE